MPSLPVPVGFDLTPDNAMQSVKDVLAAKYTDAGSWAAWAAQMLQTDIANITNKLGADVVGSNLADVMTAINSITLYTPASISFTNTDISSNSFISGIVTSLQTALAAHSTGLGDAETALFARETACQNAARSQAYTEATTFYSARGFDLPPGSLLAKQTELNNESTIRLSDSSSQIMAESARLAVDFNKTVLSAAVQVVDVLGRLFDSYVMRDFEKAKADVAFTIEGLKANAQISELKASITLKEAELVIQSSLRQLELEVTTLHGLAQSASQMVAASLNTISASVAMGFSGASGVSTSRSESIGATFPQTEGTPLPPGLQFV